jgi:hypothetical protein
MPVAMAVGTNGCVYEHEYFISYPRMKDHVRQEHLVDEFVAQLAAKIRFLLVGSELLDTNPVFLDVERLQPGTNWEAALARAVHHSRCFLAVYTQDYDHREFCQRELLAVRSVERHRLAADAKVFMIVPIVLRADRDERGMIRVPPALVVPQWADFTETISPKVDFKSKAYGRRVEQLIRHLNVLKKALSLPGSTCAHQALPAVAVREPESPEKYPSWGAEPGKPS